MATDNKSYYDAFSEGYDDKRHHGYHKLIDEQAVELVRRVGEGKRILEVGCGTGLILKDVATFAEYAYGIDISPGMLSKAEERGLNVEVADATSLPFEDNSFDVVYSFKVLAHIEDWELCMKEIMRVLRPGGHMVIDVYNKNSVRYLLKVLGGPRKTSSNFDEKAIFTRFWGVDEAKENMPEGTELVSLSGIRLCTLLPAMLRIPIVGKTLEKMEWRFMDTSFAKFAGFTVFTLKKLS